MYRAICLISTLAVLACSGCSASGEVRVATADDADGDGVANDDDRCPDEKEDRLPPERKDGCASEDPDSDGIVGNADRCPYQAETRNGYQDDDGCPDAKVTVTRKPRVTITKTELRIAEKIQFAFAKATIDKASKSLIEEIADVLKKNPQIELVEVAGHADNVGSDAVNRALTDRRARAVVQALTDEGVEAKRLRAVGYGQYCPLDAENSKEAREKNRRVDFKIIRVAGKDTGVELGCPAAAARGIKSSG
jgi:outer membrane protein OmpA-like peptidoglycan-associated protein